MVGQKVHILTAWYLPTSFV